MTDAARMYVPPAYMAPEPRSVVEAHPFGLLISATPEGPFATALPIYFETDAPDENRLVSHLALANPHAQVLRTGDIALAVFSGPHAYISASWYRDRPSVPTWNYLLAQVRGRLEVIDDDAGQRAVLARAAAMSERGHHPEWTMEQAPEGWIEMLMPRIRSFRITIDRIEAATKLSQAQPPGDRVRVIDALEQRGAPDDKAIAGLMRKLDNLPPA